MNVNDIALTLEPGLGPKTTARLLDVFGTADAVYGASPAELAGKAGLRESLAERLPRKEFHRQAEKELKYVAKHGLSAIASTDAEYPPLMREMNDYPHVLYVRGNTGALRSRCLSMVGAREISNYGQIMCDRLAEELAARVPQLCVVSGLAFGVDVHCHRAALRYGLQTVAVVANALPEVTPSQHSAIAREIVSQGGAIVSECHSNSRQTGNFYIARNRLIAGMSEGTVIVEAGADSGSLHTARFALGYNRQLAVVPGRATDRTSFGSNGLIKNNSAQMVCSGEDIIRALLWDFSDAEIGAKPPKTDAAVTPDARSLLDLFGDGEPVSCDALSESAAIPHELLASLLIELEFKGMLRKIPGGMYQKIG